MKGSMRGSPWLISVIIPVYNGEEHLAACIQSVLASGTERLEVIVVDDGSSDESAAVARRFPVKVLVLAGNRGSGAARNTGARSATGDVLFFLDSDVVISGGFVERGVKELEAHVDVGAVFASYQWDSIPGNLCSRYKNLVHHYTHQTASREAITFCGGFGFVRTGLFAAMGGFDESLRWLEDIDFGYRMHRAGQRILLCKDLQAAHSKRYTLYGLLRSDLVGRAIPWTVLMFRHRIFRLHLNVTYGQIACVPLACALPFSLLSPPVFVLLILCFCWLNRGLLGLAARSRGIPFALAVAGLHWLALCVSAVGAAAGVATFLLQRDLRLDREPT
jgi:glycosyltransferase involved in cell wall biosynthesis